MSDLLQSPSSGPSSSGPSPPSGWRPLSGSAWVDRLALVRATVTPGRVVVAVAGAVAAVVLGLVFLRAPSHPPELVLPKAGDPPPATAASGPATAGPTTGPVPSTSPAGGVGVVTVHAAGQVAAPGVYSVPAGARVADLVVAAGGLLPEADVDRLNLAARLVDGTRVYIPRKGESPPPEAAVGDPGAGAGGTGAAGGAGPGGATGPVDLNTATAAQLDTLPGVGPATAAAILTYRSRHGRFKSVTELLEVPGIGPAKLEAIRPLVTVS